MNAGIVLCIFGTGHYHYFYGYNLIRCLLNQVGGVHFSLLSKVQHDIGESCSLDSLIDSIFPMFRKHIEPDLHHAQVGVHFQYADISNSFWNVYICLLSVFIFCRSELTTVSSHRLESQFTS